MLAKNWQASSWIEWLSRAILPVLLQSYAIKDWSRIARQLAAPPSSADSAGACYIKLALMGLRRNMTECLVSHAVFNYVKLSKQILNLISGQVHKQPNNPQML